MYTPLAHSHCHRPTVSVAVCLADGEHRRPANAADAFADAAAAAVDNHCWTDAETFATGTTVAWTVCDAVEALGDWDGAEVVVLALDCCW